MNEKITDGTLRNAASFLQSETQKGLPNVSFGLQVVDIADLRDKLVKNPDLLNELFTFQEQAYCEGKFQLPRLAGRLAAKQAVRQVANFDVSVSDISIEAGALNKPYVRLMRTPIDGVGEFAVSISHEGNHALAFVIGNHPENINAPKIRAGVDIAANHRIGAKAQKKRSFLTRHFTWEELEEARGNIAAITRKWAGKEAVAKALGTGFWHEGVRFTDIAILTDGEQNPMAILQGKAEEAARRRELTQWRLKVISDSDLSFAFAIATSV